MYFLVASNFQETLFSQHLLVCALTEAGELALQLGTSVQNLISDTSLNMIDTICTVSLVIFLGDWAAAVEFECMNFYI